MKMNLMACAAVAAGVVTWTGMAEAAGGSFACERSPTVEVSDMVSGSSALRNIVNEYRVRWDAQETLRQCKNYAEGHPYEITCLNGRRDWTAILASVPQEYFGQSNEQLASVFREERRKGNGYKEAVDFCRSVGAIE